jgi:RNA polymerase sigma-70 factor (ECF subfamily)
MFVLPFLDLIDNEEDKERFMYCYYQYRNLLYTVAYDRLHDSQLAEDAVQDTYFYIAKNFHKIHDEKSPQSRNYIRLVARSKANRIAEKRDKIISLEEYENIYTCDDDLTFEEAIKNIDRENLIGAINQLDEKYKIPVMLKCIYNHRSKEIAQIMDLSDNAVRRRIYLGKRKIEKMLKGEMVINE